MLELPSSFYVRISYTSYNPKSSLFQIAKITILRVYPRSDIPDDRQVVVVDFTDGIKFEVLPAIPPNRLQGTNNISGSRFPLRWTLDEYKSKSKTGSNESQEYDILKRIDQARGRIQT